MLAAVPETVALFLSAGIDWEELRKVPCPTGHPILDRRDLGGWLRNPPPGPIIFPIVVTLASSMDHPLSPALSTDYLTAVSDRNPPFP